LLAGSFDLVLMDCQMPGMNGQLTKPLDQRPLERVLAEQQP